MPNWTRNVITATTDADFKKIQKLLIGKVDGRTEIDFNILIPMPKELKITSGSGSLEDNKFGFKKEKFKLIHDIEKDWFDYQCKHYGDKEALKEAKKQFGVKSIKYKNCQNLVKHGYKDWYDWSYGKWGTKWNGGEFDMDKKQREIVFNTAWCDPEPVIMELAKHANFTHSWEDEDSDGVHEITYEDGAPL